MTDLANDIVGELEALWRFALRLTANQADAEDLVQRTCVKALENQDQYQPRGKLRSWLFQIEHRIWLNILRARQVRDRGSFRGANSSIKPFDATVNIALGNTASTPETALQLSEVVEMVDSLPEAQRIVIILVCVEGFTYSETSEILDVAVGTVMSRLSRARMTLGKLASLGARVQSTPAAKDGALC